MWTNLCRGDQSLHLQVPFAGALYSRAAVLDTAAAMFLFLFFLVRNCSIVLEKNSVIEEK